MSFTGPQRHTGIFFVVFVLGVLSQRVGAQPPPDAKAAIPYVKPPAHAKTFRVRHIEGQVVLVPTSEKQVGAASGLHLALFNENQASVSTVVSGDNGQFEIRDAAPGFYTLVVAEETLHSLSIPLQVTEGASASVPADPALLLYMRPKTERRQSVAAPITNRLLRAELLVRVAEDQEIRNEMIRHGMEHPDKQIQTRYADIDARNLARMRAIVHRYGWPDLALVGIDGTEAAFLLLQHCPYDFQKMLLPRIRKASLSGKLSGQDYALLLDRVLMREGKPQIYGTQVANWNNKEPVFYTIKDAVHVDQRRAKLMLPPISDYVKVLKEAYFPAEKDKPY